MPIKSLVPSSQDLWSNAWTYDEPVVACAFSGDALTAAIAFLDGAVFLFQKNEEKFVTATINGASPLTVAAEKSSFLIGCDDGRLLRVSWDKEPIEIAHHKGKWIEHIAVHHESKAFAYSAGKDVFLSTQTTALTHPSTVGGIGFHPNGKRLAVSHYNGVSLWWVNAKSPTPQMLEWKGSHLSLLWHPKGDYLMTSMQENALHGWRMKDMNELRMAGYPNKVHSMGFSASTKWLATSGSEQIICWPFAGSGPQGKPPMGLGIPEGKPCTAVALHPKEELVAAGYETGRVVLALFEDQLPIELIPPNNISVTAMTWSPDGQNLLVIKENGTAYLLSAQKILSAQTSSML